MQKRLLDYPVLGLQENHLEAAATLGSIGEMADRQHQKWKNLLAFLCPRDSFDDVFFRYKTRPLFTLISAQVRKKWRGGELELEPLRKTSK